MSKLEIQRPGLFELEAELQRRHKFVRIRRVLRNVLISLLIVSAVSVLVAMLVLPVLQVHGTSMEPILKDGEVLLALRGQRYIKHGDIVAFYYNNQILLKRAIGLPGDEIDIDKKGNVFINGQYFDEPYLERKALGICDIELPITVPENAIFVLGDKRAVSVDSRSSDMGMIYGERTIGKIIFRVWTFDAFGYVD